MSRRVTAWGLAVMAVVSMILVGYFYRPGAERPDLANADLFMVLGAIALWGALYLRRDTSAGLPVTLARVDDGEPAPVRWGLAALGLTCLTLLAEINGNFLKIPLLETVNTHIQMVLLVAGTWLLAAGFMGFRWDDLKAVRGWFKANRRDVGLVALVTAAAFILRVWDLTDSVRALVDEPHMLEAINDLRMNPHTNILTPFNKFATFTWLYPYYQSLVTGVFGHTIPVFRLTGAIVGTLTIPALYALGRSLFGHRMALLAAALLAVFPPHIHFSRLGLINIMDPLVGVVALALLVRAVQTNSRRWYVLAGITFGMLFYFYDGGKLVYTGLAFFWTLWIWAMYPEREPKWRKLLWMVASVLLVAMPVFYTQLTADSSQLSRLATHRVGGAYWYNLLFESDGLGSIQSFFRGQLMPPLLHFVHLPDDSPNYYLGETGLVLPLMVPAFFLGLFHALWRLRVGGALMLLWLLLVVIGNSILREPVWTPRYVVAFPAIALLLAAGIGYTLPLLLSRRAGIFTVLIMILFAASAVAQVAYYFGPHLDYFRHESPPWKDYYDVAYRVRDLGPDVPITFVYREIAFSQEFETIFAYWGITPNFEPTRAIYLKLDYLAGLPADENHVFFLDPDDTNTLERVGLYFDLEPGQPGTYNVPLEQQYFRYDAPAGSKRDVLSEYLLP